MYGHLGASGSLTGVSFTAAATQGGSPLGLALLGLGIGLAGLTLGFAVIAIAGLLPRFARKR